MAVETIFNTMAANLIKSILAKDKHIHRGDDGVIFANIILPIAKIGNVKKTQCELYLTTFNFKQYRLEFSVVVTTTGDQIFKKRSELIKIKSKSNIQEIQPWLATKIKDMQGTIKQLRVSPKKNRLTEHYEMENVIWQANVAFCNNLGDNIQKGYGECCVCDDITVLSTNCNHFVCVECSSNLTKPKCPMCRASIYREEEEDDEDDEGDDDYSTDNSESDGSDDDSDDDNVSENEAAALVADLDILVDNRQMDDLVPK
jgi:hypothetical protein